MKNKLLIIPVDMKRFLSGEEPCAEETEAHIATSENQARMQAQIDMRPYLVDARFGMYILAGVHREQSSGTITVGPDDIMNGKLILNDTKYDADRVFIMMDTDEAGMDSFRVLSAAYTMGYTNNQLLNLRMMLMDNHIDAKSWLQEHGIQQAPDALEPKQDDSLGEPEEEEEI